MTDGLTKKQRGKSCGKNAKELAARSSRLFGAKKSQAGEAENLHAGKTARSARRGDESAGNSPKPWSALSPQEKADAVTPRILAGQSYGQIMRELRAPSRSAVAGVINRVRASGKLPPASTRSGAAIRSAPPKIVAAPRVPEKRPAPAPAAPIVITPPTSAFTCEPVSKQLPLVELSDLVCRFPHGDPREAGFGFCGANTYAQPPYCPWHSKICLTPAHARRSKEAPKPSWRA